MEPTDDRQLSKLLREWKVENAPRSLDERVLGPRRPWWMALIGGSVRVPVPILLGIAAVFAVMAVTLIRPRPAPAPPPSTVNLADFQPVENVQVRIMKGSSHEPR